LEAIKWRDFKINSSFRVRNWESRYWL